MLKMNSLEKEDVQSHKYAKNIIILFFKLQRRKFVFISNTLFYIRTIL